MVRIDKLISVRVFSCIDIKFSLLIYQEICNTQKGELEKKILVINGVTLIYTQVQMTQMTQLWLTQVTCTTEMPPLTSRSFPLRRPRYKPRRILWRSHLHTWTETWAKERALWTRTPVRIWIWHLTTAPRPRPLPHHPNTPAEKTWWG